MSRADRFELMMTPETWRLLEILKGHLSQISLEHGGTGSISNSKAIRFAMYKAAIAIERQERDNA
ncbi:MAG: hypothetical protein ACR2RF_18795 [Geminicoccaceae bacterium]